MHFAKRQDMGLSDQNYGGKTPLDFPDLPFLTASSEQMAAKTCAVTHMST